MGGGGGEGRGGGGREACGGEGGEGKLSSLIAVSVCLLHVLAHCQVVMV